MWKRKKMSSAHLAKCAIENTVSTTEHWIYSKEKVFCTQFNCAKPQWLWKLLVVQLKWWYSIFKWKTRHFSPPLVHSYSHAQIQSLTLHAALKFWLLVCIWKIEQHSQCAKYDTDSQTNWRKKKITANRCCEAYPSTWQACQGSRFVYFKQVSCVIELRISCFSLLLLKSNWVWLIWYHNVFSSN